MPRFVQPFPGPRQNLVVMREQDHLGRRSDRKQALQQRPGAFRVAPAQRIVEQQRTHLAADCQVTGQGQTQQQVDLFGRPVR